MMGGRHDPTNPREHNFGTDPAAAADVCNCGRPVRVGDYLVTSRVQFRREDLGRVRRAPGIGASLGLMLETYLDRRNRDWTSMYDPAALTLALDGEFLRLGLTPRRAEVVSGQVRFRVASEATHLRIAASIDAAAFHRELLDVIGRDGRIRCARSW